MKKAKVHGRTQFKNRLSQLSVKTKLIIALLIVSFCSMLASTYICSRAGQDILTEKVFNQLTSVRGATIDELNDHFKFIVNQTETLSSNHMFINAIKEFESAYDKLLTANIPKNYDSKLAQFYGQEFVPRLKKTMDAVPLTETFLPKNSAHRYLQYQYIANNPYPIGEKSKLSNAKDGSEYSRVNNKYNALFNNIVDRFGYYDMFLIDLKGNVVYTLAKEADFASNLLNGPVADSNLVAAYRDCRRSNSTGYVKVVDFQPYILSYNAPAAFVASPIFEGAKMIGVLAFQIATTKIDDIVNHHNKWRENGLGETGNIDLVGPDSLLRSDSRFLIENPEKFLKTLRENGMPELTIKKIREFKTTILLHSSKSEGVKQALRGKTLVLRNQDDRGIEVLGAYAPVEFAGLQWAVAVKMDVSEAFESISRFERNVIVAAALIMVMITLAAMWIARIFVQPIERLITTTQRVEAGDQDAMVSAGTRDEFNDLAREFNKTVYTFRSQIREREQQADQSEALITQLIPLHIAKRLKAGEAVIADTMPNVTVMFTDLHRFTRLSQIMEAEQVVYLLEQLVDRFDDLVEKYGLEKIKTIGDGYMAVCGLSVPHLDSDKRTIDCALEMIAQVRRFNYERGLDLDLRVGINTGEVIAGTVGKTRFTYDVWGETVNIAYRFKSASPPGGILVSGNIHERLVDLFEFEPFRAIAEPDKEALEAWLLPSERKIVEDKNKKERRLSQAGTATKIKKEVSSAVVQDEAVKSNGLPLKDDKLNGSLPKPPKPKVIQPEMNQGLPETAQKPELSNGIKQKSNFWQRIWKP